MKLKNVCRVVVVFLFGYSVYSQSSYLSIGDNYSKFKFTNTNRNYVELQPKTGKSIEIGFSFPFENSDRFYYDVSLHWDDYNFYQQAPATEVDYQTKYLGIESALSYSLIGIERDRSKFFLNLKAGLSASKMVFGVERIQGKVYSIIHYPEFDGLFFINSVGLSTKYVVSDYVGFSIGYDYRFSFFNTGDIGEQLLSFSSNQVKVGIHFLIK